jgi:ADP-ribose pyrophosphatase
MKIIGKIPVFEGNYLRVVNKYCLNDAGQQLIWETVERKNIYQRGAVVIIAVTLNGEMIFERNWRAPTEKWVIQFPAGLTDVAGETEEQTARRELLEETGYLAERLIPVIASPLSPDLTPTVAAHFYAPEVTYSRAPDRDLGEKIEVIRVPLLKIKDFLLGLPADTSLDLRVPGVLWVMEKMKLI